MAPKDKIYNKKNEKWIRLFEKFDPEGAGRIATEDFLIALDSRDFRRDSRLSKKRAALKSKVLEYGTSFITIEEFVQVVNQKPTLGQYLTTIWPAGRPTRRRNMPSAYHNYLYNLTGGDLHRTHHHHHQHQHEDVISRHRHHQPWAKHQLPAPQQHAVSLALSPSDYESAVPEHSISLPSYSTLHPSLSPATLSTVTPDYRPESAGGLDRLHPAAEPFYQSAAAASASPLPRFLDKMVKTAAKHFLDDERDRKYYADMYSCMPPPFFILTITLVELIFFAYYAIVNQVQVTTSGPIPVDSVFIFRPDKKSEIWRFFLYTVLHAGWLHLIFNLIVQLLVGLPLEMVHGSVRIGTVYMAGVLAGSLATSVFDSNVYLVGASGGVYALLAAHLANVLLNYHQLEMGLLRVVGVFIIASADVGIAIYHRYSSPELQQGSVSYVAHLAGALAGLTIGLLVLKNFEQKLHQQLMWWLALGVYTACTLLAVLFNVFN